MDTVTASWVSMFVMLTVSLAERGVHSVREHRQFLDCPGGNVRRVAEPGVEQDLVQENEVPLLSAAVDLRRRLPDQRVGARLKRLGKRSDVRTPLQREPPVLDHRQPRLGLPNPPGGLIEPQSPSMPGPAHGKPNTAARISIHDRPRPSESLDSFSLYAWAEGLMPDSVSSV